MRFRKVYLEISNICNLRCQFCPGTKRVPHALTEPEFSALLPKLRPYTDFLYFHLMGEPLCHPLLPQFLHLAGQAGFKVILTTNGTLLAQQKDILLSAPALHKLNISLHAFEANDIPMPFMWYLDECFAFGKLAEGCKIISYRLWNQGGADSYNQQILSRMKTHFTKPWVPQRSGERIGTNIYLEYGEKFDWPDLTLPGSNSQGFCYGLHDQLGVLCDGTVVPCCLDSDGNLALGNLFRQTLDDILQSPRAQAIYQGFSNRQAVEPLCQRCGYATRFTK